MGAHDRHLVVILLRFAREALSFAAELLDEESVRKIVRAVEDLEHQQQKEVHE